MSEQIHQARLASLVPRRLYAWPEDVPYRECRGAILFADITGFTRLTEQARRRSGNRGIETLTSAINALFSDLIGIIHGLEGDVLKFGGDALLVAFDDKPEGARALSSAVQCASGLYHVVARHRRARLRGLSLHVGIAAGRWSEHVVGDGDRRREHFVHGPAIADAMQAAEDSVDHACLHCPARLIPSHLPVEFRLVSRARYEIVPHQRLSRTVVESKPDLVPNDGAVRFVADVLQTWIETHSANFEDGAEHRRVSSLFVFWEHRGRSSLASDQHLFSVVMAAVERALEGTCGFWARSDPSGKKQKILILFGALQSRDDDATQAVDCSLKLRESLQKLAGSHHGFHAGIGVATATVFTGFVGSDQRREFTVMGDGINLAARLATNAPSNTVQVDESTRLAAPGFEFHSVGPLAFKNIRHPVPVYRLVSRAQPDNLSLDYGVVEHPQALREVRKRLESGSGQTVEITVAPEADARKFIHDLARSLELSNTNVRAVAFLDSDGISPLCGLSRFFRELCGVSFMADLEPSDSTKKPYRSALQQVLRGDTTTLARLVRQSGIDGLAIQIASYPPVLAGLRRIPSQISLVALSGLETLSPLDQGVLHRLLETRLARCNWIVLRNSEITENTAPSVVRLGALTKSEFRGFLADLMAPAVATRQLLEFLFQRSDGKARLARLHLSHLIARGFVHSSGNPAIVELGDTSGLDLPDDLRTHFVQQVDQLTPATQTLLRALSVFTDKVSFKTVRQLLEPAIEEFDWNASLQDLTARQLVETTDGTAEATIGFRDPVCRQAVYETMSYSLRERWHQTAAQYYQESKDTRQAAEHFFRARDRRAFPLLHQEAQRAQRLWLLDRARLYLRWAILASVNRCDPEYKKTTPPIPQSLTAVQKRLYVGLADVLRAQGHHIECARIHRRLAQLAERTHSRRVQAEHLVVVARCEWYDGRYVRSARVARRVHALATRTRASGLIALSAFLLGENYRRTGRVQASEAAYASALRNTDRRRLPLAYSDIQNGLGLLNWNCGRLAQAEACFKLALWSIGRNNDPSRRGQIANNLGLITEEQGRLRAAERYYQRAFEMFDRHGMRRRRAYSLGNLANLHRHAARFESARSAYEEVELELRAIGEAHPAFYTVGNLGDLARDFGDFATARRNYEITLSFATRSGDAELKAECHSRLALLALLEHRPRATPHHLRAARKAAATAQSCEFSLHASLVAAEYSLHRCEVSKSLHQFQTAQRQADTARLSYYQLWAAFGVAKALTATSRYEAALSLATRTAAIAERAGYRWWQLHSLVLATRLACHLDKPSKSRSLRAAVALREEIEAGIGDDKKRQSFALLPVIRRLESTTPGFSLIDAVPQKA